ncbi:hypothetical protein FGG08_007213 [Glutinoglossum americanum]|uniref:ATP synthase mitochondrial F1 complex assembly factor 1 n=1 Tax=Glutinoglossum americanum TaxID=1670608 RepID=A0A9P8I3U5_9PEZI|nr:hypothetical protein FGG08_007213 [Glutinoglossum americanum]
MATGRRKTHSAQSAESAEGAAEEGRKKGNGNLDLAQPANAPSRCVLRTDLNPTQSPVFAKKIEQRCPVDETAEMVMRVALSAASRPFFPSASPSSLRLGLRWRLGVRGSISPPPPPPLLQRRWAQVLDVRFLATQIPPSQRVLEAYREKLGRKAKEEGVRDLDELREKFRGRIERVQREEEAVGAAITASATPASVPVSPLSSSAQPTPQLEHDPTATARHPPGVKPLSSILDLPKISPLPAETISSLWTTHHSTLPNTLSASIPLSTFSQMLQTARQHPSFIIPLPRPQQDPASSNPPPQETPSAPFDMHYIQWLLPPHTPNPTILFTSLAAYKLHGEFATPHTTLTHYLDLAPTKDIVLLRGEVVKGSGVSVEDARWLVMCLQKFYGPMGDVGRRRRLLEGFTRGEKEWKVEDLVGEVERID